MARKYEQAGDDGAAGGAERSRQAAESNRRHNQSRLDRIAEIGNVADGRRASDMADVDGDRVTGRFAGGELDNSEGARMRQAEIEADRAEEARQEQAERARLAEEEEARDQARELQEEGTEPGDGREVRARGTQEQESDERVVDGVRYYRTIVAGEEKWLTLRQLRDNAQNGLTTEETLRRAQEALASASQTQPTPKADPVEDPDEQDLENIILSASMGDEEAVKKLASVVRGRSKGVTPEELSRQIAQQIATRNEVADAEKEQSDLLDHKLLGPVFRQQLAAFAAKAPKTRIRDAYKTVGDTMRQDFAAMLTGSERAAPPASKLDRKRTITTPPQSAGRQQRREDTDREVSVSEDIDAMARARGQARAHRIRRS